MFGLFSNMKISLAYSYSFQIKKKITVQNVRNKILSVLKQYI